MPLQVKQCISKVFVLFCFYFIEYYYIILYWKGLSGHLSLILQKKKKKTIYRTYCEITNLVTVSPACEQGIFTSYGSRIMSSGCCSLLNSGGFISSERVYRDPSVDDESWERHNRRNDVLIFLTCKADRLTLCWVFSVSFCHTQSFNITAIVFACFKFIVI